MSERLAIAAAFSVLVTALFALFGENSMRVSLGPEHLRVDVSSEFPVTPDFSGLLPGLR